MECIYIEMEEKPKERKKYKHGEQLIKDYDFLCHVNTKKEREFLEMKKLMKEGKQFEVD